MASEEPNPGDLTLEVFDSGSVISVLLSLFQAKHHQRTPGEPDTRRVMGEGWFIRDPCTGTQLVLSIVADDDRLLCRAKP